MRNGEFSDWEMHPVCSPWRSPHSPFLVRQLRTAPSQPEGMIVVSFFPDSTRPSCECIFQMFFERFTVLERLMLQMYVFTALNGLEARVLLGRYFRSPEWLLVEAHQDEHSCRHRGVSGVLDSGPRMNSSVYPPTSRQPFSPEALRPCFPYHRLFTL